MATIFLSISLYFLLVASALTGLMRSLQTLGRAEAKKILRKHPLFYLPYYLIGKLFHKEDWDNYFFVLSFTKHILRIFYATSATLVIINFLNIEINTPFSISELSLYTLISVSAALCSDFLFRIFATLHPRASIRICNFLSLPFVGVCGIITIPLLRMQKAAFPVQHIQHELDTPEKVRNKILEFVHESDISKVLDPIDQRLISSIASFRDRCAKEIMVPRMQIFALPANLTIKEAAPLLSKEQYSRIPIYKDSIDNMLGVLLYKDVMDIIFQAQQDGKGALLDTELQELLHPIIFTPEMKKIPTLLQEFRSRQMHLAIVVDEYGGTEGIVSIEDILEELVGEIADEYDLDEERLFKPHPNGGWIIDSKMSIVDIEKELGIHLPPNPEYDSIGGFIFHKAGTIPLKGWRLHTDTFFIEVLSSSERNIDKIWLSSVM